MRNIENLYFENRIALLVENGKTEQEAIEAINYFKQNYLEKYQNELNAFFDEVHPY